MSDWFSVDTDALAKNAPNVRAYADRLRAITARLQAKTGSLGDCWGDDAMGKAFADQYTKPRDQWISGLSGAADVMDSTADGLETMAKGFAETEAQNVANARAIANESSHAHSDSVTAPKTSDGSAHTGRR